MSVAAPITESKVDKSLSVQTQLVPQPNRLNGAPAWFKHRSAAAWDEFQSLPLPGNRDEHWRYSSAKKLALEIFQIAAEPSEGDKREALARSTGLTENTAKLVFLNDRLVYASNLADPALAPLKKKEREYGESLLATSSSDPKLQKSGEWSATHTRSFLPQGVICLPFDEALRTQGDVLEQYLMKRKAELGSEKFAALHLAHVRAGAVILVPKNVVISQPIEVFHWVTGENAVIFPHTLIVTGDHAQVTVVDHHGSLRDESCASISVADFVAGNGSRITYVNAQEMSLTSRAINISSTTVGRDASVKALQLHLGGAFSRNETVSDLIGEGARSEMLGVSLPFGDQCVDMRTLQNHIAPRTFSDLLYKNALYDQSKTVFAGLIQVEKGAHYTDAYQKCRNLLNSDEAEAASMPGLEINADQVKCSHGATCAPISEDELFYLKARGIPDHESRKLIATGFIEDVIAKLDNATLVAELDRRIEAKFAAMI